MINISSMSGHRIVTAGGSGFYSATKQALRTLTETLRQEVRCVLCFIIIAYETDARQMEGKTHQLEKAHGGPGVLEGEA